MSDFPEQGGGGYGRGKFVFVLLSLTFAFGVGFYVSASGASLPSFFKDATAIVSQTLKGVLGSSSNREKTFEIGLNSSSSKPESIGGQPKTTRGGAPVQPDSGASSKDEGSAVVKNKKAHKNIVNDEIIKSVGVPTSSGVSASVAATAPQFFSGGSVAIAPDCDFSSASVPNHNLIFNEIAWMGSPQGSGETATAASSREWMELKNLSPAEINLSGWQVLDESEKFNVIFDGGKVFAGGFYLAERRNDNSVPRITADKIYSGAMPNSGMWLKLFDKNCALADEINATSGWPGGDNTAKKTLERNIVDFAWHTSVDAGGTPKKENSKLALVAILDPNAKYTLGVSLQGDGSGTVYSSPPGISCGGDCLEDYLSGTVVKLTATSSPYSSFLGWSGACAGTSDCKLVVTSTLSVAAGFKSLLPPPMTSAPPVSSPTLPALGVNHLVLAEVQIAGASTSNDFIKIYNPTNSSVDISGWKLRKRTQTQGASDYYSIRLFQSSSSIAAQSYFVWANSSGGFSESIGANTSSTETLASNNSAALLDKNDAVVDALAWGTGLVSPYIEGQAYPTNPTANQILKRKFTDGAIKDADNNASDFEIQ